MRMLWKLYQTSTRSPWAFCDFEHAASVFDQASYGAIASGEVEAENAFQALETLFAWWNSPDRPCPRTARSMSVSDVIEITFPDSGGTDAWYVNDFGFVCLPRRSWVAVREVA